MDRGQSSENGDDIGSVALVKWRRKLANRFQYYLGRAAPHMLRRWLLTLGVATLYIGRVLYIQGFYVVSYGLATYVLNLLIGFLSPKVDPELEVLDGALSPTKLSDEYKPFERRVPEFKFWWIFQVLRDESFSGFIYDDFHISAGCSCFLANIIKLLDLPPRPHVEAANCTYVQIQVQSFQDWEAEISQKGGVCKHQQHETGLIILF